MVGRRDSPPLCKARHLGLPFRAMAMESHRPGELLTSLCALVSLIREQDIQVVNAHRAEGHLFAVLASLLLARKVIVVRTRGDVRPPKGHFLNRILHRRLTDAIVLPAEAMKRPVLERLGMSPEKLRVIPPGIDLSCFSSDQSAEERRRALGWPEEGAVVGIVGRFSPVKGHKVFLEAARLVLKSCPQTTFFIVGHEAQIKTADLKELAEKLGLSHRVRFTGFVPDVTRVVGAFDVAVVASTGSEIICRVALEHMAMARPVVGTRINAIPEVVVHGSTGLLVPAQDPRAMSQAIISLLQNPQKARVFGQAGRRRVQELFTLDHQAGQTEALYRQLLEDRL